MSQILTARWPGTCGACGDPIKVGQRIKWRRRGLVFHVHCASGATTAFRSGTDWRIWETNQLGPAQPRTMLVRLREKPPRY